MIEILIYGCNSCGLTGMMVQKVKRYHPEAKVIDTRKDDAMLGRHVFLLKQSGIDMSEYTAIVVESNGEVITRLSDWRAN